MAAELGVLGIQFPQFRYFHCRPGTHLLGERVGFRQRLFWQGAGGFALTVDGGARRIGMVIGQVGVKRLALLVLVRAGALVRGCGRRIFPF